MYGAEDAILMKVARLLILPILNFLPSSGLKMSNSDWSIGNEFFGKSVTPFGLHRGHI